MKNTIFNRTRIEGYLYQHTLELKTSGAKSAHPGTQYIAGNVDIATDNGLTNIVSVHFTYVTPVFSSGKPNSTFTTLMSIINGQLHAVMNDGKEKAALLAIDSAIGLNEFYSDRTGQEELVSTKRNEGGFITVLNELNPDESQRATFDADIIIYNTRRLEADEEKGFPEKLIVRGYIMNFRKDFLPVEFSVLNPGAMDYFEGLEVSERNPIFTRVRGRQISQVIVNRVEEEGAFNEVYVREYKNSHKDFVINWAKKDPYELGEDITADDIKKGLADRETALATLKKNRDEWRAAQSAANAPSAFDTAAGAASAGEEFHF